MDTKTNSDKKEIIDPIVKEANAIWSDYKKRIKEDNQFASLGPQPRFEYYMKRYIDFTRQWVIIVRHIASYGMYNEKAARLYINKCIVNPFKNEEEYCERQADYVKYLYMFGKGHYPANKLKDIWDNTKKCFMEELALSKSENDIIKNRRKNNKIANDITRRENLKKLIANNNNNETNE